MRHLLVALILTLCSLSTSVLAQTPPTTASPEAGASPDPRPTLVPLDSPTSAAQADSGASATPTSSATPVIKSPTAAAAVVPEYATPGASLGAFISLMAEASPLRPGLYAKARRHLDLAGIPTVVREERGAQLSVQLATILKTAALDASSLQAEEGMTEVTVYRQPSGDAIVMEKEPDGRWLVSAETVEAIPRMHKVLTQKGSIEVKTLAALDFVFLGLGGQQWLGLLLLPLSAYLVGLLFVSAVGSATRRFLGKRPLIEAIQGRAALRPLGFLMATLIFWAGLPSLGLPPGLLVVLTIAVKVMASGSLIYSAFRMLDAFSDYAKVLTARTETKFDDMLVPLARRTGKILVAFLGLLFLAQNLDIQVWSLFAGFSIFGAMVALAGQDLVKNIFGSITVFTDQPFRIGDSIKVEGIEGIVEDVGFRSTRLKSPTGALITLPNSRLITAAVDNMGVKPPYKQLTKRLRVPWSTPPDILEAFCEGVRELVRKHPYTRKDGYQVWVNDMSDFALEILVDVFWIVPDAATELRERHRFLIDLHRLARALQVEFVAPTQRVMIVSESALDPDEPDFTLEAQRQARARGKSASRALLEASNEER